MQANLESLRAGVADAKDRVVANIRAISFVDLILMMTLLTLVIEANETRVLRRGMPLFVFAGILIPGLMRRPWLWFALLVMLIANYAHLWFKIDNHKYLLTYWTIAVAFALLAPSPRRALRVSARLIIGLCFACAILWKIVEPEFLSGTFFHFTILTDARFFGMSELITGVLPEDSAANALANEAMHDAFESLDPLVLASSDRLEWLGPIMAWWTIIIEGLIAIMFLWPFDDFVRRWRHLPLMLFIVTTYPIATVDGFAYLLALMATSQCYRRERVMPIVYLAIFILIPLFAIPYVRLWHSAAAQLGL